MGIESQMWHHLYFRNTLLSNWPKKNDLCLSTLLCYISHLIVHVQMDSGNDFFWALIVTFWSPKLAIFWEHGHFSGFEVLLKIGGGGWGAYIDIFRPNIAIL